MRSTFTAAAAALAFAASMGSAQAELVQQNWNAAFNDGWLTADTQTGLTWLDVPLTLGQNLDEVRSGYWAQQGFRLATKGEVQTLFAHAGIPDDNFDITVTHPQQAIYLISLLGATQILPSGNLSTLGWIGTPFTSSGELPPIGTGLSGQLGKIHYIPVSAGNPSIGEAHFSGGHPFSTERGQWGAFMVRASAVPEPGSIAMLAVGGLMAAGWTSRRKARKSDTV